VPGPRTTQNKQSSTTTLFAGRKPKVPAPMTHERIAEDLVAFHEAGGEIEVLGVTRSLQRIGLEGDTTAPPMPAKANGPRGRG
jgi:hypothetical protein